MQVVDAVANRHTRPSLEDVPPGLGMLLTRCWHRNAAHRPALAVVEKALKRMMATEATGSSGSSAVTGGRLSRDAAAGGGQPDSVATVPAVPDGAATAIQAAAAAAAAIGQAIAAQATAVADIATRPSKHASSRMVDTPTAAMVAVGSVPAIDDEVDSEATSVVVSSSSDDEGESLPGQLGAVL